MIRKTAERTGVFFQLSSPIGSDGIRKEALTLYFEHFRAPRTALHFARKRYIR